MSDRAGTLSRPSSCWDACPTSSASGSRQIRHIVEKPFGSSDTRAALSKKYVQSVQTCGSQPRFLIRCSPNLEKSKNVYSSRDAYMQRRSVLFSLQNCIHAMSERVLVRKLHTCNVGAFCFRSRIAYMPFRSFRVFGSPSWFLQNLCVIEVLIVLFGSRVLAKSFHTSVCFVSLCGNVRT